MQPTVQPGSCCCCLATSGVSIMISLDELTYRLFTLGAPREARLQTGALQSSGWHVFNSNSGLGAQEFIALVLMVIWAGDGGLYEMTQADWERLRLQARSSPATRYTIPTCRIKPSLLIVSC